MSGTDVAAPSCAIRVSSARASCAESGSMAPASPGGCGASEIGASTGTTQASSSGCALLPAT
ncbi:MAG: hypothetical protein ACYCSX_06695 [Acidimicrobiales bacterium]